MSFCDQGYLNLARNAKSSCHQTRDKRKVRRYKSGGLVEAALAPDVPNRPDIVLQRPLTWFQLSTSIRLNSIDIPHFLESSNRNTTSFRGEPHGH